MVNQDLFNYATKRASGPFYLAIKTNRHGDDETWYEAQLMEVNKINSMHDASSLEQVL